MAFVLSSVSGNLISAASAGYAPTNSADVSAIASAYQVVSATATQLYAGTNYVTSINETTISAERAGRAGNATLATSAYYDTNSRFISSLPDSAAVSAIASAYAESAASSKQDTLAFAYNTADQISSINGSALGGMDEAAVSAIASAYAESAASGKLDSSAFNSGDFYSTSNPSGFITGVDLSPYQTTADMSSYIPTSMSSDFQQVTGMSSYALSADVSGTVDLVSTQSANWGGSALALSAGPGVKLEKSGNTLVASTDETVLWSASGYSIGDTSQSINLSESPLNFNTIRIYGYRPLVTSEPGGVFSDDIDIQWLKSVSANQFSCPYTMRVGTTQYVGSLELSGITSTTWLETGWHCGLAHTASIATNGVYAHLHKVVGINRTAGV